MKKAEKGSFREISRDISALIGPNGRILDLTSGTYSDILVSDHPGQPGQKINKEELIMASGIFVRNGVWRLDIDPEAKDYEVISRGHKFQNRLTVAYKFQDSNGTARVFVAFEKQTAAPFEIRPSEKAVQAFDERDWDTLSGMAVSQSYPL